MKTYTVKPGDIAWNLGEKVGANSPTEKGEYLKKLQKANPELAAKTKGLSKIKPGMVLNMPELKDVVAEPKPKQASGTHRPLESYKAEMGQGHELQPARKWMFSPTVNGDYRGGITECLDQMTNANITWHKPVYDRNTNTYTQVYTVDDGKGPFDIRVVSDFNTEKRVLSYRSESDIYSEPLTTEYQEGDPMYDEIHKRLLAAFSRDMTFENS